MSTMEERVNGWLDSLSTLVDKAKEQKEQAGPLTAFITGVQRFGKSLPADDDGKLALVDALGSDFDSITTALTTLVDFADSKAKETGQDRSEGDQMAKSLSMAVESSLLEGEARERAEGLLVAWKESAPKGAGKGSGSSGSSSPAGKALPFPVKVTCEADNWSARQTGNVNSLRWAAILHHEKEHGGKPAKGDPIHTGLTEAINSVVDEKSQSAQGGGYIVDRTA